MFRKLFAAAVSAVLLVLTLPVPTVAADAPRAPLWVERLSGLGGYNDFPDAATSVGVSPDGTKVFVTGGVFMGYASSRGDFGTVAYDARDGHMLWFVRYNGGSSSDDGAYALAVSPDGTKVFVTGESGLNNYPTYGDYATVAYNAANGAQLWVARYNGPGNRVDAPAAIRVSPDGTRLFVTGTSPGSTAFDSQDYATVAYNASNGAQLWVARYNGPTNGNNEAFGLAVNPRGTTVFVTGASNGSTTNTDFATVAYDAADGGQRWVARYNGPANGEDVAYDLRVSPDGTDIVVVGVSSGTTTGGDYATIDYNAESGKAVWGRRYTSPGNNFDAPYGLGVSPDGTKVFVTGRAGSAWDYATVAYDLKNGTQQWAKGYNGPGNGRDSANGIGVSPDGTEVFVTGGSDGSTTSQDYATLAYSSTDGAQLWVSRYNGPSNGWDFPSSLAVNPNGTQVFVTGGSGGETTGQDYATVAYSTVVTHPPHIFEVEVKTCNNLHVGYNYFPANTVVHWNLSQAGVKVVSGQQFTTLGGGRTYHFLTMPLGVTLQPEATAGEATVRFSWTINGVLSSYKVQRDPGC